MSGDHQPKPQTSDMEIDENNVATCPDAPMEVAQGSSDRAALTVPLNSNSNAIRVMASSGTVGSVSISLHPLVIMNVSEHWTRLRAQEGSDQLGMTCSWRRRLC